MDMRERWNELWRRLGSTNDMAPLLNELLKAYGEQQRAYHDFSHVLRCLEEFDGVKDRLEHPDEVELAIWFHDIIYDPKSSRNEEYSAEFAVAELKRANINGHTVRKVKELILATRHDGSVSCPDAQYLTDIDIASLGSSPEDYREYEKSIRKEYHWAPESAYRRKRTELLESFLKNNQIYRTAFFRRKYGQKAKRNIEAAIRALSASDPAPLQGPEL